MIIKIVKEMQCILFVNCIGLRCSISQFLLSIKNNNNNRLILIEEIVIIIIIIKLFQNVTMTISHRYR